jgi:hypothetical protein
MADTQCSGDVFRIARPDQRKRLRARHAARVRILPSGELVRQADYIGSERLAQLVHNVLGRAALRGRLFVHQISPAGLAYVALKVLSRLACEFAGNTTLAGITLCLHTMNDSIAIIKRKNRALGLGKTPMF